MHGRHSDQHVIAVSLTAGHERHQVVTLMPVCRIYTHADSLQCLENVDLRSGSRQAATCTVYGINSSKRTGDQSALGLIISTHQQTLLLIHSARCVLELERFISTPLVFDPMTWPCSLHRPTDRFLAKRVRNPMYRCWMTHPFFTSRNRVGLVSGVIGFFMVSVPSP